MMKKTVIALALALACAAAQADAIRAEAPVTAAVLYLNGAAITRTAAVEIPAAGVYDIELPAVGADSVQVQVDGGTLQSQGLQPDKARDAAAAGKESELTAAKEEISQNNAMQSSLTLSLKEHPENFTSVQQQLAALREANIAADKRIKALQEDIDALKRGGLQTAVYTIVAPQAGTVHLTLRYFSRDASWQPQSTINLNTQVNTVSLAAYAQVSHQDEAWDNVKLTLALTPPRDAQLPQLYSESVSARVPQPIRAMTANIESADMALYSKESAVNAAPQAMQARSAGAVPQIIANGVDFRVELPNAYHIAAASSIRLPYYQAQAKADISTAVYSWVDETPLLLAQWKQPQKLPFLAGEADIQRDGLSIGTRYYREFWQSGSLQKASFGADPAFTVSIQSPPGYTDKSGVFNKRKVEQTRWRAVIENLGGAQRPAAFYVRVPQAGNSDTEVDTQFSSRPSVQNAEGVAGIYRWDIGKLGTGKAWMLDYGYDISYPENMQLQ